MSVTINHQTNSVEPSSGDLSIGGSGNVNINNEATVDGDVTIDNRNRLRFADVGVDKALIGTHTGTRLYMGSEGSSSDPRIRFDGQATQAAIEPTLPSGSTGSGASGYLNLGSSTAGFKDLYLDGGVYLGGTGSDNLLNDYEIGTWNPTSGGAGTLTVNSGAYYTKVGRNVTLHINSAQFSDITSTSALGINGLPFAPSGSSAVGTTMMSYRDDTITIAPFIPATVSQIRFYQSSTTAGFLRVKHNILNSTSNALYVSITYQTA